MTTRTSLYELMKIALRLGINVGACALLFYLIPTSFFMVDSVFSVYLAKTLFAILTTFVIQGSISCASCLFSRPYVPGYDESYPELDAHLEEILDPPVTQIPFSHIAKESLDSYYDHDVNMNFSPPVSPPGSEGLISPTSPKGELDPKKLGFS